MRWIFRVLSLLYVSAIFLMADSPVVASLSFFNPYSLLHVPAYGILTVLLVFSFTPVQVRSATPGRLFLMGSVALLIGIADELNQSRFQSRDASLTDVLLDLTGICIAVFFVSRFLRK